MNGHLKRKRNGEAYRNIHFVVLSKKTYQNGSIELLDTTQVCLIEANQNNYILKVDSCQN